jgi:hypothetical protein
LGRCNIIEPDRLLTATQGTTPPNEADFTPPNEADILKEYVTVPIETKRKLQSSRIFTGKKETDTLLMPEFDWAINDPKITVVEIYSPNYSAPPTEWNQYMVIVLKKGDNTYRLSIGAQGLEQDIDCYFSYSHNDDNSNDGSNEQSDDDSKPA